MGAAGSTFALPVRVNTCGKALTGFQIRINFDSAVIEAVSVASGSGWPFTVTPTIGSPSTQVQLLSSEPASNKKSNALHIATVTFKRVASGKTPIEGYVVETLSKGGIMGVKGRAIVAGNARR